MTERGVLAELPTDVAKALGGVAIALGDVDHPLDRLAVIRMVRERLDVVLDTLVTLSVREARDDRHTLDDIGRAYGVSAQRAHQLSRQPETTEGPQ